MSDTTPTTTTSSTRGYLATQLGEGLVKARDRAGLSQRAQARRIGVAGNTLRELELGLANPTLGRVEDLAESLDLVVELRVKHKRGRR